MDEATYAAAVERARADGATYIRALFVQVADGAIPVEAVAPLLSLSLPGIATGAGAAGATEEQARLVCAAFMTGAEAVARTEGAGLLVALNASPTPPSAPNRAARRRARRDLH